MPVRPFARLATTAGFALFASISATPAFAAPKEKVVYMPASVIAKPESNICMPRSTSLTVGKDKTLPATLCQTAAEWQTHGVRIAAR